IKTRKKSRQEKEKDLVKQGHDVSYPSWADLTAEEREEEPAIILTVTDDQGNVMRRLTGPATAGFHRVAWDLGFPPPSPTHIHPPECEDPFKPKPMGPIAVPGPYKVSLSKRVEGVVSSLGEAQTFQAQPLGTASLPATDRAALQVFERKTARLQRAVM